MEAAMTKQQIATLATLGLAVLCVLGLGGYIVVTEEQAYQRSLWMPTATPAVTYTPTSIWTPSGTPLVTPTRYVPTTPTVVKIDDDELEDLCKDWLYYRKKILEHEAAGDTEKADEARQRAQQVSAWLAEYDDDDVDAMFDKLEREGYEPP
jgi:hypothetical protein